jgi:hypothetical protein
VSRRWSAIANLRLALFAILAVIAWFAIDRDSLLLVALGVIVAIAVTVLVVMHRRLRRERDTLQRLIDVEQRALARLRHDWASLPPPIEARFGRDHPYAWDLNIVGDASVIRRIGTPITHGGRQRLLAWLTESPGIDDLPARQEAVRELAPLIETRHRVQTHAPDRPLAEPAALLDWAEGIAATQPRWLVLLARMGPVSVILLALAQIAGLTPWPLWLLPVTIQVIVSQLLAPDASRQVAAIGRLQHEIEAYSGVFASIAATEPVADRLCRVHDALVANDAAGAIARLRRVCSLAIPRGTLLYIPFQMIFLWDVNVLGIMERWRRRHGPEVRPWLEATADWEALAALAVLAHDEPTWAFPAVDPLSERFEGANLRHPLIPARLAVGNDVAIGPEGTMLVVTGSNMSGKSTLLRSTGANAVLALAGGPVAADALTLPPVDIRCCMRVEDSVERGVSYFMAELLRLKAVVDAAKQATPARPVLYLLDEILQGTNTGERQIASRRVLRTLAGTHAIGAVSSHDLDLVDDPAFAGHVDLVHFAETFDRGSEPPVMTFDYQLRPGLATSTNALALMEVLGFDTEEDSNENGKVI